MNLATNLVFCALVVLTSSSQTKGKNIHLSPILTLPALPDGDKTSSPHMLPLDAGDEVTQWIPNTPPSQTAAGQGGTPSKSLAVSKTNGIVQTETVTHMSHRNEWLTLTSTVKSSQRTTGHAVLTLPGQHTASFSAAPDSPPTSSTQKSPPLKWHFSTPDATAILTGDSSTASEQPSAYSAEDITPPQRTTQPRSETLTPASTRPPTASHAETSAHAYASAGPMPQEGPSELNVGDEDLKGPHHHPSSPLDPLLAGLVSVFIVTTAIISVVLFLKFRQRTNNPEFHRLQDLPMDDLMEDTPLSRYTY